MLTEIHPKLPMRDKAATKDFYLNKLDFQQFGSAPVFVTETPKPNQSI
jgi:hypothetical protein